MGNVGIGIKRVIQDVDGETATVTDNRLDVNAAITVASDSIDIGDVQITGNSDVTHFAQNVTDSAVILTDVTCKQADIMANLSNTGIVYIGDSGVSATTGIALYPGDVYSVSITRTALLYVISTVSGDDINVVTYK